VRDPHAGVGVTFHSSSPGAGAAGYHDYAFLGGSISGGGGGSDHSVDEAIRKLPDGSGMKGQFMVA
jgi:hypothetical protein